MQINPSEMSNKQLGELILTTDPLSSITQDAIKELAERAVGRSSSPRYDRNAGSAIGEWEVVMDRVIAPSGELLPTVSGGHVSLFYNGESFRCTGIQLEIPGNGIVKMTLTVLARGIRISTPDVPARDWELINPGLNPWREGGDEPPANTGE